MIDSDKIIEFTKKLIESFIVKEHIEAQVEDLNNSIKLKTKIQHTKQNFTTFKSFIKIKQMKLYHKFALLMNLFKLDVLYEKQIFFDFMITMLEDYFKYQEICYEEVIFGLNLFEIALSNIEKRYLTENFSGILIRSLKIAIFLLVSVNNQEKIMKIFINVITLLPYDDLKFFSIYEAINNLKDQKILTEFISPSVSSKNFL